VKGKTEPVGVYEVLDYHNEDSYPQMMDALGHFGHGISLYRGRKWLDARKEFEAVLKLNPDDALAGVYVERCNLMKKNPPAKDWRGEWIMTSK